MPKDPRDKRIEDLEALVGKLSLRIKTLEKEILSLKRTPPWGPRCPEPFKTVPRIIGPPLPGSDVIIPKVIE